MILWQIYALPAAVFTSGMVLRRIFNGWTWRAAASNTGLAVAVRWLRGPEIRGSFRGREVSVVGEELPPVARFRVSGALTESITIRPPRILGLPGRPTDLVRTGDAAFDDAVDLQGDELSAIALLDAGARSRIVDLARGPAPVTLAGGVLTASRGRTGESASQIRGILAQLLDLSNRLARTDLVPMLEATVRRDPVEAVRIRALRLLLERFPRSDAAASALEAARRDASPELRLAAATWLPLEGDRALALSALLTPSVPPDVRVRALAFAEQSLSRFVALPILAEGTRSEDEAVRAQAVWGLGRLKHREGLDAAISVADTLDAETQRALAAALAGFDGDAGLEAALLGLVERGKGDAVRARAAESLGEIGTIRAVEPLLPHARSIFRTELRQAAEAAIAKIQSRAAEGAAAGQVSISEAQGSLSLPEGLSGALSDAPSAGALSLDERRKG